MKKALLILTTLMLPLAVIAPIIDSPAAGGVSMKDFDAGNIIDDATFYDSKSMSASTVQSFLNKKVPKCDTQGSGPYGGTTVKKYWTPRGEPAPYTCLKDWKQDTPRVTGVSGMCSGIPSYKNRSAAQIITDVSKACGVSPKVLLVLLEKEKSLVTDTSPLSHNSKWSQYKYATGFACPDTAPCNPKEAGFFNQVYSAAYQFKLYRANPTNYNYIAGQSNYIQYNPNASCGGSYVKIKNQATAGLYNYTPYQPNKATLNVPVGVEAPCGAYGNKNFWFMFNNWFGSTTNGVKFKFEKLVGQQSAKVKLNSRSIGSHSKTLAVGNTIYTFYHDETNKTLRYAFWNGKKWSDHLVDGKGATTPGAIASDVGKDIDAVSWNGQIQVYYYDATNKDLRHAWLKNGNWRTESMDGSNTSVSKNSSNVGQSPKVLVRKGGLQLYYYDQTNGSLKHAWWPGDGRWHFETMDGTKNSLGKSTANVGSAIEAFMYKGNNIQLYYYDQTNGSLKHAWWNGKEWRFETMDGTKNSLGKSTANVGSAVSATPYNGGIQMFYYNKDDGELKHAWWNGKKWRFETMDGDTDRSVLKNHINAGRKIAVRDFGKDLVVFYYDDASNFSSHNSSWRLAYWNGSSWQPFILDGGNTTSESGSAAAVTGQLSVDILNNKSLQVYYRGADGALMHAWYTK